MFLKLNFLQKRIIFIFIFFLSFTRVTYADYSLKCVMESHYKFFDKEAWETTIRPITVFIKNKTIEYIGKYDKTPLVYVITENNNNSIVATKINQFNNKTSLETILLDKNENRVTFMSVNYLGLTVYSGICNK